MFEYKFVKLTTNIWNNLPKEDYQAIIAEHAEEGWRLVQIFSSMSSAMQMNYELIFERPKTDYV